MGAGEVDRLAGVVSEITGVGWIVAQDAVKVSKLHCFTPCYGELLDLLVMVYE